MDKNKIKIRYDKDGDILYILSAKGPVKDTIEIGEDVFVEIDKNGKIVGIDIWQARKNIFAELIKYLKGIRQEIKNFSLIIENIKHLGSDSNFPYYYIFSVAPAVSYFL